jgi:hypothetical protein
MKGIRRKKGRRGRRKINKEIIIILLFNWTANGFLPGGSGTTIRHNLQMHISHRMK